MSNDIGDKLMNLRASRTREEVASSIGISVSAIQMYENGKRIPRDEIKLKLAQYYNVSVDDLFFCTLNHDL